MLFQIVHVPIDPSLLQRQLANEEAGACVTFEGWVRRHNDGHAVQALEYEAYEELANKEGLKILEEACEKFGILNVIAVHRVGLLRLGETAVWVSVTAAHRDAAFAGCRYVIDEIKARVPIWKKEHYESGSTEWINCAKP
ncbi:MAG TPA: molybdenum cofactor biosynthesis protein MoaE [Opitutaceae bacterium]|nr:molybdenum cofactor biosynthesis protein MoaE [Opitutaceae bacterium]